MGITQSGCLSRRVCLQCRGHRSLTFDPWMGKSPWRRKWQPTPVFVPRESNGQRSFVGYSPRGCKELDPTRWVSTHSSIMYTCQSQSVSSSRPFPLSPVGAHTFLFVCVCVHTFLLHICVSISVLQIGSSIPTLLGRLFYQHYWGIIDK